MRVSLELLRANAKEPPRVHQALSTLGGMTIPSLFKDIMKETVESIPPPTFSEEDIKSLSQASIKIAKHQRKSAEPGDASFQEDIQDSTAAVTEAVEKSKEEVTQAIQDSLVRVTDELRQTQEMVRSGGQSTTLYTGGIHWEQEAAFKALSEKIDSLREEITGQPPVALTAPTGETGDMTGALLRVEQNQTKVFDSIDQIQSDLKQLAASVSQPVPGSQPTLAAMASSEGTKSGKRFDGATRDAAASDRRSHSSASTTTKGDRETTCKQSVDDNGRHSQAGEAEWSAAMETLRSDDDQWCLLFHVPVSMDRTCLTFSQINPIYQFLCTSTSCMHVCWYAACILYAHQLQ